MTTRHVEYIEFADVFFPDLVFELPEYTEERVVATELDPKHETYVVHIGSVNSVVSPSFSPLALNIYPSRKLQIAGLIAEKAPTKALVKYADFVFSPDLVFKLPKHTGINDHAIELVNDQQPPYRPIYTLGPVDLEGLH